MKEPYLSHFQELVRAGAGTQDIHDIPKESGYAVAARNVPRAYVEGEVQRVSLHQESLCPLLEEFVGRVDSILDVGCGTGGTTVAMALSPILQAARVVGVDPNPSALETAAIRARGYDLSPERVLFSLVQPGQPLPFPDNQFQLTVCVSVLEYIYTLEDRERFVAELQRVTQPGGFIFLATPSPFRLRDYHSHRLFGEWLRKEGFPWSSPPWQLRRLFRGCQLVPLHWFLVRHGFRKRGVSLAWLPGWLCRVLAWLLPWQKILAKKGK